MKKSIHHICRIATALALPWAALPGCVADTTSEPEASDVAPEVTGDVTEPLIGGTYTSLRPEIGFLSLAGGTCTGTLVDPRFVLTAAHCVGYTSTNVNSTFNITSKLGAPKQYTVDKTFALGPGDPSNLSSGVGSSDVAIVRLSAPVPASDADPTGIWPAWPTAGTAQTIFGYGCQDRGTKVGPLAKQYYSFMSGSGSSALCPGDSGGPVVWYGPTFGGYVFAVNSGYDYWGNDLFGDAATLAPPGLNAVTRLSNTLTTNEPSPGFAGLGQASGAQSLVGDFNGDGLSDIALTGGSGWGTLPVAFSNGDGRFANVTAYGVGAFAAWAQSGARAVAGDFNGDGRADVALVGGPGWNTIPVAFSNGDGSFSVTNWYVGDFAGWAQTSGVQVLVGDFNGDGLADIAMTGPSVWSTVPIAFSNGNGTFSTSNKSAPTFAYLASRGGARAVAGDFNGDGAADIALTGPSTWSTVPVAFSDHTGSFALTNQSVPLFPQWATSDAQLVAGDFDGDGRADLALTGGPSWITVALALSQGDGNFTAANLPLTSFPDWSRSSRRALVGKFNNDGQADIALMGGNGWSTIPIAFFKK